MKYKNNYEDDNEIIFMINENNEHATEYLIKRYKRLINYYTNKYIRIGNILGIDKNDIYLEGLYGFIESIKSYNENLNIKFITYTSKCIEKKILALIKRRSSNKNYILNRSLSIDNYNVSINDNTINSLIINENINNIINNLKGIEKEIILFKLYGLSNNEIIIKLGIDSRKIYNAMYRVRNKLKY